MVNAEQVPDALVAERRWVCWWTENRDGKPTKVPADPASGGYARVDDPGTWTSFDAAVRCYRERDGVDGVGFVFHAEGPYAGVDLDGCVDPETGEVAAWAREVVDRLDSYTERSPSGTGLHVIVEGVVPDGGNRADGIEVYDRVRYFTFTGDHVDGTPGDVRERTDALEAVHAELIADSGDGPESREPGPRPDVDLSDLELVRRAMGAANGDKFARLWRGDTSDYPSHSEADLALCSLLAFWTGGDEDRIEALFGRSGLVREKWWERPDYRERTIRRAVESCTAFYDPAMEVKSP